jgi:HK97 family phage prohead protease
MDEVVLNDESVMNDYGFYTLNSGLDLTRFRSNPVILVNHNVTGLPIGKVDVETLRIDGAKLVAKVIWDEADTDVETQRLIAKYKSGFMKGFSIGMLITKMQDRGTAETPQYYAVKSELYELSAVTIPSNKNTVCLINKPETLVELQRGAALITLSFNKEGHIFLNHKIDALRMEKVLNLLGLAANTSDEGLLAHLSTLIGKMTAMETHRIEAALTAGRASGTVTDVNVANYRAMLKSDFENTYAILAATTVTAPTVPPVAGAAPEAKVPTLTELMAAFQLSAKQTADPNDRSNWTITDWQQKDAKGLATLQSSKPTEYAALLTAHRKATGF